MLKGGRGGGGKGGGKPPLGGRPYLTLVRKGYVYLYGGGGDSEAKIFFKKKKKKGLLKVNSEGGAIREGGFLFTLYFILKGIRVRGNP